MKKKINITGFVDTDKKELELNKNGMGVPELVMTITGLIQLLYNCIDKEDVEDTKQIIKDISDNPEKELEQQFKAVTVAEAFKALFDRN